MEFDVMSRAQTLITDQILDQFAVVARWGEVARAVRTAG